jgi:dTDP-4-amino-4,6-dideoxygalactose transaminase
MSDSYVPVPLVDLGAQYRDIEHEIRAGIDRVLERHAFINGQETREFEARFAAMCAAADCIAVSSGTTALELALRALGVGRGDEVITVSHTFFATISAIVSTGATPVLVDVDPTSWTMAPLLVEQALSERTKAIVPVHIYGHPADVPAINAVAPTIPVVEDAAQAHLARYHGSAVGSCAAAACFSFYPGKNLGAYGDAGAVTTSDPELALRVRALRDHGRLDGAKYEHAMLGTNARASELQMAVLNAKLPHLPGWTAARQRLADSYESELDGGFVQFQSVMPWADHARHLFVLLHPDRDRLVEQLHRNGIGAGVHYPIACHQQPALIGRWRGTAAGLPVTEQIVSQCLSLPLFPELHEDDLRRIAGLVREAAPVAVPS